jgi:NTE family protein
MLPKSHTTAFVFAGGGSLGAIQAGMLRELTNAGVRTDLVVGSSVGAMNASYFAGDPTTAGVARLEEIWRGIRRHDVFPVTLRSALGLLARPGHLIDPSGLKSLVERHLPYRKLEEAMLPVHVIATNLGAWPCASPRGRRWTRSWRAPPFRRRSRRFASARTI